MFQTLRTLKNEPAERSRLLRQGLVLGTGIAGGLIARQAMTEIWERSSTKRADPPLTPGDPGVGWRPALTWAVASGVAAGLGRLAGRRMAAGAVERA